MSLYSPSHLASPSSSSPGTLREHYVRTWQRFYPHIQPRHDWDIVVLGSGLFKDGDFYAHSDSFFQCHFSRFTPEQVKDGSARIRLIRQATELLDKQDTPTGVRVHR